MQFQVPQFIDVEDKIVGSLTMRQFFFLAGVAGASFLLFFLLEFWLWFIITTFLVVFGLTITFIKVNGRPMSTFLLSAFNFYWGPQTYIWKPKQSAQTTIQIPKTPRQSVTKTAGHGLKSLLQKLTTSKETITRREPPIKKTVTTTDQAKTDGQRTEIKDLFTKKDDIRRVDYR